MIDIVLALALQTAPAAQGEAWGDAAGATFDAALATPEARAFDFWIGEWRSNWRPREEDGLDHVDQGRQIRQHVFTILGGKALIELAEPFEPVAGEAAGRGFSIRYRDGETGEWIMAQHWPNPSFDGVAFADQLIGRERHGRIQLYSFDRPRSTPETASIRRYTFSDIAPDRFRWDGANTGDGGDSWSVWQVVEFHRQAEEATTTPMGSPWPGQDEDLLCTDAPHGAFDFLEGDWMVTSDSGAEGRFRAGRMLDGCGVAGVMEFGGREYFRAWAWSPVFSRWVQFTLSDIPGERHVYAVAREAGEGAVFTAAPGATIESASHDYWVPLLSAEQNGLQRTIWRVVEADRTEVDMQSRPDADSQEWTTFMTLTFERR